MEYFDKLNAVREKSMLIKHDLITRFDMTDWEHEITNKMLEDEEYTPVSSIFNESGFRELRPLILNELTQRPNSELCDSMWKLYSELQEIHELQMTRLKDEYFKLDPDFVPFLFCKECGFFGYCEKMTKEHTCKKTTTCRHCDQDCKTYDRLRQHIEKRVCLQAYVCNVCNYKTNSHNEWMRHSKSKYHKEMIGFKKESYHCVPCDFKTEFQSKYKEHCNKKKHRLYLENVKD